MLLDTLPLVAPHLRSVQELCKLAACSKGCICKTAVQQFAAEIVVQLLTNVVQQVRRAQYQNGASVRCSQGSVRWLLKLVGVVTQDAVSHLLMVPCVPDDDFSTIFSYGLRFSLQQLGPAARQRVAVVEYWVQHAVRLGHPCGIP